MTRKLGSNPKDLLGAKRVPLGLLPPAGLIYGARAMQFGASKYGPYNWRANAVVLSIYLDAIERHLLRIRDGDWLAADSGVEDIGHIIACAAIIADAYETGNLVDDRPLPGPAGRLLDEYEAKHRKPKKRKGKR